MEKNYVDIYYKGKIKNKYSTDDVYGKIQNYIKRKKLNKEWNSKKESDSITINFNDNISDNMFLDIHDGKFEGTGRINDDKQGKEATSEKVLDMFFSIKGYFSKFEIDDDFSICKSYLQNKKIKIELLELTDEEIIKIKELFSKGYNNYRSFIFEFIANSLGLKSYNELYFYDERICGKWSIYENSTNEDLYLEIIHRILTTWLYNSTLYKG